MIVASSQNAPPASSSWDAGGTSPTAILALFSTLQSALHDAGAADVEVSSEELKHLRQALADELERVREARDHSGFWGSLAEIFGSDVTTIAAAVASVAGAIATGGAGTPFVLAVLAAGLTAGAKVAELAGLDPRLCAALGIAAAAVSIASGAGAGAIEKLSDFARVQAGANLVGGGAAVVGAGARVRAQLYDGDALVAEARAAGLRSEQRQTELDLDEALTLLKDALDGQARDNRIAASIAAGDSAARARIIAEMGSAS